MALTDRDIYVGWLTEWILSLCLNVFLLIPTLRFFWCNAQSNEDDTAEDSQSLDKNGTPKQIVIMPVRVMAILYFVFWSIACMLLISEAFSKVTTRDWMTQYELDIRDNQEDLTWMFGISLAGAAELIFCLLLLSNLRAAFKDTVYECGRKVYVFYAVLTFLYTLSGLAYIGTVLSEEVKWVRVMLMMSTAGIVLFTRFTLIALFIHKLMLLIAESSARISGSSVTPAHTLHLRNLSALSNTSSPATPPHHDPLSTVVKSGSIGSGNRACGNHLHTIVSSGTGVLDATDVNSARERVPVPELSADGSRSDAAIGCHSMDRDAAAPTPADAHAHSHADVRRHNPRDRSRLNDTARYAGHMNTITKHLLLGSTAIVVSAVVVALVLIERAVRTLDDEDNEPPPQVAEPDASALQQDAQDFNAFTFVAISLTIITVWIEWTCVFLSYTFNDRWYKYFCRTCHTRCCMPCTGKRVLKMRRSLKGSGRSLNIQVPQTSA